MPLQKIFAPQLPDCFQPALSAPRYPRIGGLFLGLAGYTLLDTMQLPHVGHKRLRQLYRSGDFESSGFFERGLCRCQNGQNIYRVA